MVGQYCVFRYTVIKTVTNALFLGKWMYKVNADSASTTVVSLRCSLTQLGGHLQAR